MDILTTNKKWVKQYGDWSVTFFRVELPTSRTFESCFIGWYESDREDHVPVFFETEPSEADIEALFVV